MMVSAVIGQSNFNLHVARFRYEFYTIIPDGEFIAARALRRVRRNEFLRYTACGHVSFGHNALLPDRW